MMDHARAQSLFSDYCEGTLEGAERDQVRQHLTDCATCRTEYDTFVRALSQLGQLKDEAPPPSPEFLRSLQVTIARRSKGRFFAKRPPRFPLETVSLVTLLIMVVIYLFLIATEPRRVKEPRGALELPPSRTGCISPGLPSRTG